MPAELKQVSAELGSFPSGLAVREGKGCQGLEGFVYLCVGIVAGN